jgi:hypothetical protein
MNVEATFLHHLRKMPITHIELQIQQDEVGWKVAPLKPFGIHSSPVIVTETAGEGYTRLEASGGRAIEP